MVVINVFFTDHLIHGNDRLYVILFLLFSNMITHNIVPDDLLESVLIPIPKDKRKSLNDSKNYHAIAMGCILLKLLDLCILNSILDIVSKFAETKSIIFNASKCKYLIMSKTPVTHGWMYCRIAVGYQIWKIVSDLRIIFFICEHVHTMLNVLVASATDVKCP